MGSDGSVTFVSATPDTGTIRYNTGALGSTSVPIYGAHGGSALDLQTGFPPGSGWTTTPAGATAFYVDFGSGYELPPGKSVDIILNFLVPATGDQTIYNQFWYSAVEVNNPLSVLNLPSQKGGFSTKAIMITYDANLPTPNLNDLANLPSVRTATLNVDGEGPGKDTLSINSLVPTLTGYVFAGWNTKKVADDTGDWWGTIVPSGETSQGTEKQFSTGGTLALFAQWTRKTVAIS